MNEFRNMLLSDGIPTEDVDELLLKIIEKSEKKEDVIMSNKIQYRRVGDYLIPNLILPPEEINITLGKWGMMHKSYLEKHKKVFLVCCLVKVNFISTVPRLKNQALAMFDMLVEQLKEENQLEWVQKTNLINISAREIVENEILYG